MPAVLVSQDGLPLQPDLLVRRGLPLRRDLPLRSDVVSRHASALALIAVAAVALTACGPTMMLLHGRAARRPAPGEFGLGPRPSAQGHYVATLVPERPLRPRQMQTIRVAIVDDRGLPIDGAALTVGGGMPQHGHGLPTRPRVTRSLGDGTYEIEGVRFNMGGWWQFSVTVAAAAGTDVVTFNLDL
ncbi:MAG: FixH family protein [Vicinamibacterales bacterium]